MAAIRSVVVFLVAIGINVVDGVIIACEGDLNQAGLDVNQEES